MPAPRDRLHLLIPGAPQADAYTPHPRKIEPRPLPIPRDRPAHAASLTASLTRVRAESAASREAAAGQALRPASGIYVEFEAVPGVDLKLESLGHKSKGIEVVAVRPASIDPARQQHERATVFIPDGAVQHFLKRFQQYAAETTATGKVKHADMLDRVASLRRATLAAFWTDEATEYPVDGEVIWWELWLRKSDGNEVERFLAFAQRRDVAVSPRRLAFDDRIIVLAEATTDQLASSIDVLDDIAELRKAKFSAALFVGSGVPEPRDAVARLKGRLIPPGPNAPAVCVLDTGVTRGHPLLEPLIAASDATAVDAAWGAHDNGGGPQQEGHGTQMAGLAAYGNLAEALIGDAEIVATHRLESVKILPPTGANDPELYGAITAQAVARPEIVAPERPRTFSLAVTSIDDRDRGQPTSWSAAIDALAMGRSFDQTTQGLVYLDEGEIARQRLFVVSTGNVSPDRLEAAHLNRSDVEPVHDPAQSWNALTVGAATDLTTIGDPQLNGWSAVAPAGELSPWSTTSVGFADAWPNKPDVVCEGGNVATNGTDFDFGIPDLSLLSTNHKPTTSLLTLSWATSAATAQVACVAAIINAQYPALWPETVRGLVVHSARWTRAMQVHFDGAPTKRSRARLIRRYGMGVPDLRRALRSATDSLTLIAQGTIRPFQDGKMREMHTHVLPWPTEVLAQLGEVQARLRLTLSYFIEPNPARRGWSNRYRYSSHGLRFEVKAPTESVDEFRKRINKKALAEEEDRPTVAGLTDGWFLGDQGRNHGSVHTDVWTGAAADLAASGVIGVFPVSGWWKDQPKRDRSNAGARYALVASIETDAEEVDLWTPVAIQIGIPIRIET